MKWELEDLSFKALDPERYRELASQPRHAAHATARPTSTGRSRVLTPELREGRHRGRPQRAARSTCTASGRRCSARRAAFGEIYDVYAIRLLVDEVRDCYAALGVVHSLWKPIPGQFDDYIAVPKTNGYQSLHTAVIALDGKPLEIQIRTHAMHAVSEVGIAAHWRYKEGSRAERDYDAKLAWLRQLMDWQREVSDAQRVRRGDQARHLPGPGLRLHAQGRHQGPPGRRHAARLRLPDPHRRRPPDDRREGEQPPRPARLPAPERRHRRDRDDEGASTVRRGTGSPSSGPAMPARRSANGSRRRTATRTSSTAGSRSSASCGGSPGRRSRRSGTTGSSRSRSTSATTRSTTSTRRSATAPSPPSRSSCASASSTTPSSPCRRRLRAQTPHRRGPGQGRGRPPRPVREVLPPDPRRPDRRLHHPRQGRDGPPQPLSRPS